MCYSFFFFRGVGNVFNFFYFFLGGIFLADIYVQKVNLIKNEKVGIWVSFTTFLLFYFTIGSNLFLLFVLKFIAMIILVHTTLMNKTIRQFFSNKILCVIGGMCYSIYLIHFAVISALGTS
ncbi:MAG: hypothetical protein C4329_10815 [Chitinophagaceae bacterium]